MPVTPTLGKQRQKRFPASCQTVTLAESTSPSSLRDTVLEKKRFKVIQKDTQYQSLISKHAYAYIHIYTHMLINTCKHIHNIFKVLQVLHYLLQSNGVGEAHLSFIDRINQPSHSGAALFSAFSFSALRKVTIPGNNLSSQLNGTNLQSASVAFPLLGNNGYNGRCRRMEYNIYKSII